MSESTKTLLKMYADTFSYVEQLKLSQKQWKILIYIIKDYISFSSHNNKTKSLFICG